MKFTSLCHSVGAAVLVTLIGLVGLSSHATAQSNPPPDYLDLGKGFGQSQINSAPKHATTRDTGDEVEINYGNGRTTRFTTNQDANGGVAWDAADQSRSRAYWGDQEGAQADGRNPADPHADWIYDNASNHGHNAFSADPFGAQHDANMYALESDFTDVYNNCETPQGAVRQESGEAPRQCSHVEAPVDRQCQIHTEITLTPKPEYGEITVLIAVDRSVSMGRGTGRMDAAKYAALKVAQALQDAPKTRYSVVAFPGDSREVPEVIFQPVTRFGQTWEATENNYATIRPEGGSTPIASAMDHGHHDAHSVPGDTQIVLTLTDGEAFGDRACTPDAELSCTSSYVRNLHGGETHFPGIGIQINASRHFDSQYATVQNNRDIGTAMFAVLGQWYEISNRFESPECVTIGQNIDSGLYSGNYQCIEPPDENGCAEVDGLWLCDGQGFANELDPQPLSGVPHICGRIQVGGVRYCWTAADGSERCSDDAGTGSQECQTYRIRDDCELISSVCEESTRTPEGRCLAYDEQWQCGISYSNASAPTSSHACAGAIDCMDGSCLPQTTTPNASFGPASTMLSTVNWTVMDQESCSFENGCEMFKGQKYECRNHRGPSNCCGGENVPPGELETYMLAARMTYNMVTSQVAMDLLMSVGIDGPGMWSNVTTFVGNAWSAITEPFVNAFDSLAQRFAGSLTNEAVDAATDVATSSIKDEIINQIGRWSAEYLPEALTDLLFQKTSETAGNYVLSEGMAQAANIAGGIMAAYTAYKIAEALYQIGTACEVEELEFNMKRERLYACHLTAIEVPHGCDFGICDKRVTTGCCFNSPLGRILQEQFRAQLGIPWHNGDPEHPDCRALSMAEFESIDWAAIDFTEWEAIMLEGGIVPEDDAEIADMYGLDGTSRNREDYDYYNTPDAQERIDDRVDRAPDPDDFRNNAAGDMYANPGQGGSAGGSSNTSGGQTGGSTSPGGP